MSHQYITLHLNNARAIVLFEFLSRFSETEKLEILDQAEERVLWDIHAELQKQLTEPFDPEYTDLLEKARSEVRDKMI